MKNLNSYEKIAKEFLKPIKEFADDEKQDQDASSRGRDDGDTWMAPNGDYGGKHNGKIQYFDDEDSAKVYAKSGSKDGKGGEEEPEEPKGNIGKSDFSRDGGDKPSGDDGDSIDDNEKAYNDANEFLDNFGDQLPDKEREELENLAQKVVDGEEDGDKLYKMMDDLEVAGIGGELDDENEFSGPNPDDSENLEDAKETVTYYKDELNHHQERLQSAQNVLDDALIDPENAKDDIKRAKKAIAKHKQGIKFNTNKLKDANEKVKSFGGDEPKAKNKFGVEDDQFIGQTDWPHRDVTVKQALAYDGDNGTMKHYKKKAQNLIDTGDFEGLGIDPNHPKGGSPNAKKEESIKVINGKKYKAVKESKEPTKPTIHPFKETYKKIGGK